MSLFIISQAETFISIKVESNYNETWCTWHTCSLGNGITTSCYCIISFKKNVTEYETDILFIVLTALYPYLDNIFAFTIEQISTFKPVTMMAYYQILLNTSVLSLLRSYYSK